MIVDKEFQRELLLQLLANPSLKLSDFKYPEDIVFTTLRLHRLTKTLQTLVRGGVLNLVNGVCLAAVDSSLRPSLIVSAFTDTPGDFILRCREANANRSTSRSY